MKTRQTIAILLLILATGAWAQGVTQQLVVWHKNGEKVRFNLTEEPRTTFEGGQLVITTSKGTTYYQLSNIQRYTFEGISSGIEAVTRDLTFGQTADGAVLNNVEAGTVVRLYDTAGMLLEEKTSDGSPISFSLSSRPAGVYVVSLKDKNFKISKR